MQVVDRVVVRGLMDCLDAATLIDGNVNNDSAWLHAAHHVFAHDNRSAAARHEHCADHQVGICDVALDCAAVRGQGDHTTFLDLIDPAKAVDVLVEQHDLGLHARCDPRRVPAHVAGPEYHDFGWSNAGCATQQHAAATVVSLEIMGSQLRRQAAGYFAHRRQQRKSATFGLHRFVGDARGAGS